MIEMSGDVYHALQGIFTCRKLINANHVLKVTSIINLLENVVNVGKIQFMTQHFKFVKFPIVLLLLILLVNYITLIITNTQKSAINALKMNSLLHKQRHARKKILFLFVERKLHSLIYQSYLVKHVPHKSLTLIHITMFVIHVLDKNLYIIHNKKFVKLVLKEENIIIKQENVTISKIIKSLLLFIHKT